MDQIVLSVQYYCYLSSEGYLKIKIRAPNRPLGTVLVLLLVTRSLFEDQNLCTK